MGVGIIDILVFVIFVVVVIGIGLWQSRVPKRVKAIRASAMRVHVINHKPDRLVRCPIHASTQQLDLVVNQLLVERLAIGRRGVV